MEGAASQIHRGIPHLHSGMTDTDWCSAVGPSFKSTSASMSNLETLSVTRPIPFKEGCGSSFPDLCQNECQT